METELFNARFERLVKERGLQKKDIAESCGISTNGISTWKVTGSLPRADIAVKIARKLNVTTEYLVTGEISGIEDSAENALAYTVAALPAEKKKLVRAFLEALDLF